MDQKKVGRLIKALRSERNLTQEQLAEQFSVSRRTVSRWETGSNLPDLDILIEMSEYFGVDLRNLLAGEKKCTYEKSETGDAVRMAAEVSRLEKEGLKDRMSVSCFLVGVLCLLAGWGSRRVFLPAAFFAEVLEGGALIAMLLGIINETGFIVRIRANRPVIIAALCIGILGAGIAILFGNASRGPEKRNLEIPREIQLLDSASGYRRTYTAGDAEFQPIYEAINAGWWIYLEDGNTGIMGDSIEAVLAAYPESTREVVFEYDDPILCEEIAGKDSWIQNGSRPVTGIRFSLDNEEPNTTGSLCTVIYAGSQETGIAMYYYLYPDSRDYLIGLLP